MRSSALVSTALLLASSAAQYFSYDDFSDDFSLDARDLQYGDLDTNDFLYSREADMDFEDDGLYHFERRAIVYSTTTGDKESAAVFKQNLICLIDKKIVTGEECRKKNSVAKLIGTMDITVLVPAHHRFSVVVEGGPK